MSEQQHYPVQLWSYLRRVADKGLKKNSLPSAVQALNRYKPPGFFVTVVGAAELRESKKGVELVGVTLKYDDKSYQIFLTLDEVLWFLSCADARQFVPSVPEFMVKPKDAEAVA